MSNEEREKLREFLAELRDLCGKYKYKIGGCGCCGSPWIDTPDDRGYAEYLSASRDGASVLCGHEEVFDEQRA